MSAPLIHHHLSVSPPPPLCLSDRAVASVLQGGCPGEQYRGEEALGMHSQHYASKATNLREFFLWFFILCVCVLGILDSSSLAVANSVYKLEQHMKVWVGQCFSNKSC